MLVRESSKSAAPARAPFESPWGDRKLLPEEAQGNLERAAARPPWGH